MKPFIEKWAISVLTALSIMLISGYVGMYLKVQRLELSGGFSLKRMDSMELIHKEDKQAMWRVIQTKKDK